MDPLFHSGPIFEIRGAANHQLELLTKTVRPLMDWMRQMRLLKRWGFSLGGGVLRIYLDQSSHPRCQESTDKVYEKLSGLVSSVGCSLSASPQRPKDPEWEKL